ncbi:MAG: carboxymuconolactone decarboxylase family protein, partial [Promethearchaeota archaeon]
MELISKIKQNAKYSHDFLKENSEVYQMYNDLNLKAFQDGLIERKYKEFIGLGIAIVVNCESCIYWHISSLFKLGCKYEELLEVFEVAIEMGGGPA